MKADNKEECEEYEKPEGLRGDLAAAILFSFLSWAGLFVYRASCASENSDFCPVLVTALPPDVLVAVSTMCLIVGVRFEQVFTLIGASMFSYAEFSISLFNAAYIASECDHCTYREMCVYCGLFILAIAQLFVGFTATFILWVNNRENRSYKLVAAISASFLAWCGLFIYRGGAAEDWDLYYAYSTALPADVLVFVSTTCLIVGVHYQKVGILLGSCIFGFAEFTMAFFTATHGSHVCHEEYDDDCIKSTIAILVGQYMLAIGCLITACTGLVFCFIIQHAKSKGRMTKLIVSIILSLIAICGLLIKCSGCMKEGSMYDEYCGYFQIVPQDVTVFICTMCLIIGVQHDMVGMLLGGCVFGFTEFTLSFFNAISLARRCVSPDEDASGESIYCSATHKDFISGLFILSIGCGFVSIASVVYAFMAKKSSPKHEEEKERVVDNRFQRTSTVS